MADATPKTVTLQTPSTTTLLLLAIIAFLGWKEYVGYQAVEAHTISGKSLAKKERSNLLESRARALDAARLKLDSGGSFDEAQKAQIEAYDEASKQLYMQEVWPLVSPLFPTGGTDGTPAQKASVSKLFADESAALRGLK